ncbi:hypothetical protein BC831DRAFT_482163 [Entophlyctis helioformis]|nr:hypothetical protein BC831DRAFT_482163 [Entophlyctis helioformis]
MSLRASDINATIIIPPSLSPTTTLSPATQLSIASPSSSSPMGPIPFGRPLPISQTAGFFSSHHGASTSSTAMAHWLYEMQKSAWILSEKVAKYQTTSPVNMLNIGYRRKKIVDLVADIRAAWVQLLLDLSIALSHSSTDDARDASGKVNRLAVATGTPADWQDLNINDAKSLFMQGEKYFVGYGVTRSFDVAFKRYEAASKLGLAEASNMMGVMLEFGLGRERDVLNATKWYRKAADARCPEALNNLGRIHELGRGCEVSLVSAIDMYKRAADLGHLDGMTNYGYMLENGLGKPQDLRMAAEMYRAAADLGYARAQNALGSCYYRGRGVRRDFTEAASWYRKASEQGFPPALNNLGICHEEGHGVAKDALAAKSYYRRAAEGRHPSGTCNLGYMHLLEGDYIGAIQHFHIAMTLGSIDAAYHLGTIYESGCADREGVITDPQIDLALRYYQHAADQGHTKAQIRMATLLICLNPELNRDDDCASVSPRAEPADHQATIDASTDANTGHGSRSSSSHAKTPSAAPHASSDPRRTRFVTQATARALRYLILAATPSPSASASASSGGQGISDSNPQISISHNGEAYHSDRHHHDRHHSDRHAYHHGAHTSASSLHHAGQPSAQQHHHHRESGDADAQNMLGEMLEMGHATGLEGDGEPAAAAVWYRRAIQQGHARAMFNLGALYESGLGVGKDHDKALRLYREAARRGCGQAIQRIAQLADLSAPPRNAADF